LRGGEGGGVFSSFKALSRFLDGGRDASSASDPSLSLCDRFNLLLERSSLDGGAILLEDDDDDVLLVGVDALVAVILAAARAALEMGTWIPSEGRESDFRRVLYGMVAGRGGKARLILRRCEARSADVMLWE
jgi:hypothetical protein